MKTAVQLFIDYLTSLEDVSKSWDKTMTDPKQLIPGIKAQLETYLPIEKQQIIDAHINGWSSAELFHKKKGQYVSSETYYTKTFTP